MNERFPFPGAARELRSAARGIMEGEIYKVTEENPLISMTISRLLSEAGLSERSAAGADIFACFSSDGTVLGIASGRQFGTDSLLVYITVAKELRGRGTGSRLVNRILSYYSGACARSFVLSPEGAEGFFEKFGFRRETSDKLPQAIRESRAAAAIELAANTVMELDLPKKWPIL
jgi:N-acetylglutamate synthase-like GNAT family acetyltransferase